MIRQVWVLFCSAPIRSAGGLFGFVLLSLSGTAVQTVARNYLESRLALLLIALGVMCYQGYLLAGLLRFFGGLSQDGRARFADLLRGHPGFLSIAAFFVIQAVILMASLVPGFYLTNHLPTSILPVILIYAGVFFVIWFNIKAGFTMVRIVVPGRGVFDALVDSFRATRGRFWKALVLLPAIWLFGFSGLLLLGVGFLVTGPMAILMYMRLTEEWSKDPL